MQFSIPIPSLTTALGVWVALKAIFAIYLCKKEFQHIPLGSALSAYKNNVQFPNVSFLGQNTLHRILGTKIRNFLLATLINPEMFVLKMLLIIPLALISKFLGKTILSQASKKVECEDCRDTRLIHNRSFVKGGQGEWQYCPCRKPEQVDPEKLSGIPNWRATGQSIPDAWLANCYATPMGATPAKMKETPASRVTASKIVNRIFDTKGIVKIIRVVDWDNYHAMRFLVVDDTLERDNIYSHHCISPDKEIYDLAVITPKMLESIYKKELPLPEGWHNKDRTSLRTYFREYKKETTNV
jgi:hypothetical protein